MGERKILSPEVLREEVLHKGRGVFCWLKGSRKVKKTHFRITYKFTELHIINTDLRLLWAICSIFSGIVTLIAGSYVNTSVSSRAGANKP